MTSIITEDTTLSWERGKTDDEWIIPCPHDVGDYNNDKCSRCWASHQDATPYCASEEYKRVRDNRPT